MMSLDTKSLHNSFEAGVKVVQNLPECGSFQASQDLMLKFYALYRQAKSGPCKQTKPAFWDAMGRAKWSSWKSLEDLPKETAMILYVEELKNIVEAMPHTPLVSRFIATLDNFYEPVVDTDDSGLGLCSSDITTNQRRMTSSPAVLADIPSFYGSDRATIFPPLGALAPDRHTAMRQKMAQYLPSSASDCSSDNEGDQRPASKSGDVLDDNRWDSESESDRANERFQIDSSTDIAQENDQIQYKKSDPSLQEDVAVSNNNEDLNYSLSNSFESSQHESLGLSSEILHVTPQNSQLSMEKRHSTKCSSLNLQTDECILATIDRLHADVLRLSDRIGQVEGLLRDAQPYPLAYSSHMSWRQLIVSYLRYFVTGDITSHSLVSIPANRRAVWSVFQSTVILIGWPLLINLVINYISHRIHRLSRVRPSIA